MKIPVRAPIFIVMIFLLNATARPQVKNTADEGVTAASQPIRVLELRNYVTKPRQR